MFALHGEDASCDDVALFVLREEVVEACWDHLLDAEAQLAFFLVDVEDPGLDVLADAEFVRRVIQTFIRRDFADVNHGLDARGELDEGAECGEAGDLTLDDGTDGEAARSVDPGVSEGLLEAQRKPLAGGVNGEDHDFGGVSHVEQVPGFSDLFTPGHFGDMDQAFDAWFELKEGAEIGEACNSAAHAIADLVPVGNGSPGVREELLHAERDAMGLGFDLEDLDLDLLTDGEHLFGFADASPGDLADVEEAVDAAEIDKSAEVGETANSAPDGVSDVDLRVAALPGGAVFRFGNDASIDDDVFVRDVEFGDAAADLLADEVLHLRSVSCSAARGGHEGAEADVDGEAAFDDGGDGADDNGFMGEGSLHRLPILGLLHPDAGELVVAFRVSTFDGDGEFIADAYCLTSFGEERQGQNALSLETDIEEDGIGRDGNDRAIDLLALRRSPGVAALELGEQISERLGGFGGEISLWVDL